MSVLDPDDSPPSSWYDPSEVDHFGDCQGADCDGFLSEDDLSESDRLGKSVGVQDLRLCRECLNDGDAVVKQMKDEAEK